MPAEVYEHPANEFVAGFVGVFEHPWSAAVAALTIRPEKVRILDLCSTTRADFEVEQGRIKEVVVRRG